MKTIEAIDEALEILSNLQLNGQVRLYDGDRLSRCIKTLHTLQLNLKENDHEFI
jgi:hypothetical protein|tara:strand:+ start:1891 stop:2052 length:162 start_codon:yes stop_codon:yes gene_type:complete